MRVHATYVRVLVLETEKTIFSQIASVAAAADDDDDADDDTTPRDDDRGGIGGDGRTTTSGGGCRRWSHRGAKGRMGVPACGRRSLPWVLPRRLLQQLRLMAVVLMLIRLSGGVAEGEESRARAAAAASKTRSSSSAFTPFQISKPGASRVPGQNGGALSLAARAHNLPGGRGGATGTGSNDITDSSSTHAALPVFVHTPKTGGRRMTELLEAEYGAAVPPMLILGDLERFRRGDVVMSFTRYLYLHFDGRHLPDLMLYLREQTAARGLPPPRVLTLLRDPVQRIVSE